MDNCDIGWPANLVIVLVETSESLNVGSVSRAMMNFGFADLRLVSPIGYSGERARITACGALGPLENLKEFKSLPEAISDCQNVVGFSARDGKNRGRIAALPEWIESLKGQGTPKTALVFGPEDNGLRQEHVEVCSSLIHVPTSSIYPSMNLAQAVTAALYEFSRLERSTEKEIDLAEWKDFEQLDLLVSEVATMSGFFHRGTPQPLPSVLKTIFRRQELSKREMAIMLGLFGTTVKAMQGKIPIHLPEKKG